MRLLFRTASTTASGMIMHLAKTGQRRFVPVSRFVFEPEFGLKIDFEPRSNILSPNPILAVVMESKMPARKVLDVGQCDLDHSNISQYLAKHFEVEILRAHTFDEAIQLAGESKPDLVLINRLLDTDQSAGLEILKTLKANETTSDIPVMLVSNFEDAQAEAVATGAEQGFGKANLTTEATTGLLEKFLK